MEGLMESLLLFTFILYLLAFFAYAIAISGKKVKDQKNKERRWGNIAIGITIAGAACHLAFTIIRVLVTGHFPTSNMFEFTTFLCFAIVLAFIVIFFIYRSVILGAFAMPLAMIILAYAAVFPREVQPLVPALQSYWLTIHVGLTALASGMFAVGFVAGIIYLINQVGNQKQGKNGFFLELILLAVLMFVGFIFSNLIFKSMGYEAQIAHIVGGEQQVLAYELPPLVGPTDGQVQKMDSFLGMDKPLMEAPSWMKGTEPSKLLNSTIWGILTGLILYGLIRLITRKRIGASLHPLVKNWNPELIDEISYRSTAIAFPIFTLGALIFAMIWAHEAWGRFWGWDPKEVWALITWLFYSAYLHLRLSRGWLGIRSAWLVVGGFLVIMFNQIFINLVISGLHSYA
jgi:ABC-type transport system involved in cytochrome c biogenesis permease subunit